MPWLLLIGAVGVVVLFVTKGSAMTTTETSGGGSGGGALSGNCCGAPFVCSCPGGCGCVGCAGVQSCCNGEITADPATWPGGDAVWNIAQAIAKAEGASISGSAPDRYNNPGDLSKGDEHGQAVDGYVQLPDGETLIQFSDKSAGWSALYSKLQNIASYKSSVYSPDWTWYQIGGKWAGNSEVWANNVAAALGVNPATSMGQYLNSGSCAVAQCGGCQCG